MMEIHPALLAYQIVVFLIFLFLMYRFVYRPIFKVLQKRQDKIEGDIKEAEKDREEMSRLREQYAQKMAQVGEDADRIIKEAEREANERRNQLMAVAKQDAATVVDRAERRISEEEANAVSDIRKRTVEISLGIAEKILKEKVDAKKDRVLAKKFLDEVESEDWKSES
jgi:F-type H+-transporting ATPase subunit b